MSRKLLYRTNTLPYHVTARNNNKENFALDLVTLWKLMGTEFLSLRLKFGVEIHSFVLMPNHFHLLVTIPEYDLGVVMNDFMSNVTKESNRITGRSGHMFGGPYHWSLITSSRYYGHALKYVYRNPVKAKLRTRVEDYPFSTLYGLIGRDRVPFPIFNPRPELTFSVPGIEPYDLLNWLNKPIPSEAEKIIKKGLRKKIFDELISRKNRTEHSELIDLL
jgi:putative transposase